MNFWLTTQTKSKIAAKAVILTFAVIATMANMATPVFADTKDVPNNIVVYDNREKTLKITEISFTNDFTSMSVLVENIQTKADFRIEHELNTEDTFNEHIEITATDGMGNVSETVNIKNPFYLPEIKETIPEPEPIKGSLSVTGGSGSEKEKETESNSVSEGDKITSANDGFSTNGWATVVDNTDASGKEFFIVRSETGNEFYVVIDRQNGKDNVYFLNSVTEWDLLGLTQKYEVPNNLDPNSDLNDIVDKGSVTADADSQETKENSENQEGQPSEEPGEKAPTEAEPPKQGGVGIFGIIMLILFVGAVGAYFYFFKLKRKPQNTNGDDYLPDDYGNEDDEDEEDNDSDTEESEEEYEEDDYEEAESPPTAVPKVQSSEPISNPTSEVIDKDVAATDDNADFTDDDVGDTDYDENDVMDDYGEEVDENDVLGGLGGDEDEEDNVI